MVFHSADVQRRTGLMLAGVALLAFAVGFVAVLVSQDRAPPVQIVAISVPSAEPSLEEVVAVEDDVAPEEEEAFVEQSDPQLVPDLELTEPEPPTPKHIAKRASSEDEGTISEFETLNPF